MGLILSDTLYLGTATPGSGGGGGGGSLPDQTGHSGEFLTTDGTDASWAAISGGLPSQTGQSGKFLTTDGTDASWATINALQNTATGSDGLTIAGTASTYQRATNVGVSSSAKTSGTAFGRGASAGDYAVALGQGSVASNDAVAVGFLAKAQGGSSIAIVADSFGTAQPTTGSAAIAIGQIAAAQANNAIQLGNGINSTAYTFSVGFGIQNNYRMLDSDGTIPADRLPNAINKYSTMPTAASTNVGWIVQFTGATDSTYTHGYIYECKAQGTTPETYAWEAVEVQAGGGGGLPSQTGNSGKFLTTDGTDASWSDKPLVNTATGTGSICVSGNSSSNYQVVLGYGAGAARNLQNGIFIGRNAGSSGGIGNNVTMIGDGTGSDFLMRSIANSVAIGTGAKVNAENAIQINISATPHSNADTNTVKIGNNNGNFEIMSADGTIPAARHATLPAADGTYVLKLVIASGVPTLSWVAE